VHDVALQNLDVTFAIDRGGVVGEDGPTHHGTLDLTYLKMVPNLIVMSPKDENELRHMLYTAIEHNGPAAVRYPRDYGYGVPENGDLRRLEIGRGEMLREGRQVCIVAVGSMVIPSLRAAELLEADGISAAVINARFVKPIDDVLITDIAKSVELVVTVEENSVKGGFGSEVVRTLAEADVSAPVRVMGIPDEFVEHAPRSELLKDLGLSAEGIAGTIRSALGGPAKKARRAGAQGGREL